MNDYSIATYTCSVIFQRNFFLNYVTNIFLMIVFSVGLLILKRSNECRMKSRDSFKSEIEVIRIRFQFLIRLCLAKKKKKFIETEIEKIKTELFFFVKKVFFRLFVLHSTIREEVRIHDTKV